MSEGINTAAVLGAGVMGSAIAAHLAGAGIRTHLLDIVPPNLGDDEKNDPKARNRFAQGGLEKALKAKPAAFFTTRAARLVTPGNLDDHLERLKEADLVIEAVVENLEIKKSLFEKIAPYLKAGAVLASNTSGLSIKAMNDVLPEALRERFLVLHFFNPVRYMHLLEVVPGPKTKAEVVDRMARFGEFLGKGIVYGKDTPNFVANRIGVYGIMATMKAMVDDGFTIEQVDKIVGKPMGRPKSAAFNTCDIVGIDTMVHVAQNCYDSLPNDEARDIFQMPDFVRELVKEGRLGRKSGAGFYKKEGKEILVYDYKTKEYRSQEKVRYESLGAVRNIEDPGERLKALVNGQDDAAKLAWKLTALTLTYSARRLGEIADDIVNIDRAMRWGFNWDLGPFEAWDAIGVPESVARMQKEGYEVPQWVVDMLESGRTSFYEGLGSEQTYYDGLNKKAQPVEQDPRQLSLTVLKSDKSRVVKENLGASLIDLGDGVLGLEVHTKMNTLDDDVVKMLEAGITEAEENYRALVIGNQGEHFGAGANIMMIVMAAQQKAWDQIEGVVRGLQGALQRAKYAKVPVVAAPFNLTLGGCCEVAMAVDARQAHAETYIGLVEVGVGLVPAGGGCLRMVERWTADVTSVKGADVLPFIGAASLNIATAKVATSAEEAKELRFLLPSDGISLNKDYLLHDAKALALGLAQSDYRPPLPPVLKAAGKDAASTIGMQIWGMKEGGYASEHDALIANKIAHILCGGNVAAGTEVSEQHYLDLECEAFLSLCGETKTQERIQHMLMKGKPLRN